MLLIESLLNVRQKNATNMSDEDFKKLLSYDPNLYTIDNLSNETLQTANESFSKWLIKMYNNGDLQNYQPADVRTVLSAFEVAKGRRNLLPNNDINSYHSVQEIGEALKSINDNLTKNQKNKDAKKNQNALKNAKKKTGMYMNGAVELLFNGDDWEVWTPHTYEGSKALRRGASWCTGGDTDNYYKSYTENGTLYVIMNKKDNSDKYQLFVPFTNSDNKYNLEKEYRDKDNESQNFRELCLDNPELLHFFMTQDDVTEAYPNLDDPDVAENEWTEEKEDEVVSEYGLGRNWYDGSVLIYVSPEDATEWCHYLSPRFVKQVFKEGFSDYGLYNTDRLKEKLSDNYSFINCFYDYDYVFEPLYNQYKKETQNHSWSTTDFIDCIFSAGNHLNEDISNWLLEKNQYYKTQVLDCINEGYTINDTAVDYIYNEFEHIYGIYLNHLSNDERDTDMFPYDTGYDSVEEFYNEIIVGRGMQRYSDLLNNYNLYFDDSDLPNYVEDFNMKDRYDKDTIEQDAHNICKLFLNDEEYYDFEGMPKNIKNIKDKFLEVVGEISGEDKATELFYKIASNNINYYAYNNILYIMKKNHIVDNDSGADIILTNCGILDYHHSYNILNIDKLLKLLTYINNDKSKLIYQSDLDNFITELHHKGYDDETTKKEVNNFINKKNPELFNDDENEEKINEVLKLAGVK